MEHDMDEMMNQVAQELLEGIEKKDHKMVMDALTALVLHIQDQDQEQDSQMEPMSWRARHRWASKFAVRRKLCKLTHK